MRYTDSWAITYNEHNNSVRLWFKKTQHTFFFDTVEEADKFMENAVGAKKFYMNFAAYISPKAIVVQSNDVLPDVFPFVPKTNNSWFVVSYGNKMQGFKSYFTAYCFMMIMRNCYDNVELQEYK